MEPPPPVDPENDQRCDEGGEDPPTPRRDNSQGTQHLQEQLQETLLLRLGVRPSGLHSSDCTGYLWILPHHPNWTTVPG